MVRMASLSWAIMSAAPDAVLVVVPSPLEGEGVKVPPRAAIG
jgi:hypothetical protein